MRKVAYRPLDERVEEYESLRAQPPPIQVGVVIDPMPGSSYAAVRIGKTNRATHVLVAAGLSPQTGDRVLLARSPMIQTWVAFADIDTATVASDSAGSGGGGDTYGLADDEWQMLVTGTSPHMASWMSQIRPRAELLASHTSMGESHALGGEVVIAPCGSLRTAFSTE